MKVIRWLWVALFAVAVCCMAACGGGDDGDDSASADGSSDQGGGDETDGGDGDDSGGDADSAGGDDSGGDADSAGGGDSDDGAGGEDNDDVMATCPGPGETPDSGSGTEEDPYEMKLSVRYGGCVPADGLVVFVVQLTASGVYTVTQSNGTTDLELYVVDEDENELAAIDDEWGGLDESASAELEPGIYYVAVYNNGAAMGSGDQESPFSLIVTGPE